MYKTSVLYCLLLIFSFYSCSKDDEAAVSSTRTVLVYMAADNNLSYSAHVNISQMEESISSGTGNGNLLVYIDSDNAPPSLIQITRTGKKVLKVYPEQNSASSNVLHAVIDEVCGLFPSDSYGLVLWSHATAWLPANSPYARIRANAFLRQGQRSLVREPFTKAFAQDGTEGTDWMELSDLTTAIPDYRFDFILFDACYMSSVEVVYALRNKADVIIASPTEVLTSGFPYDKIADKLLSSSLNLTEICQIYFDTYQSLSGIEQSASIALIKTKEIESLLEIVKEISTSRDESELLPLDDIQCYDRFVQHLLFDMDDYISRIANEEQLNRFRTQLDQMIPFKLTTNRFYNAFNITHFSGLSVYIPQESLPLLNVFYNQMEWAKVRVQNTPS